MFYTAVGGAGQLNIAENFLIRTVYIWDQAQPAQLLQNFTGTGLFIAPQTGINYAALASPNVSLNGPINLAGGAMY